MTPEEKKLKATARLISELRSSLTPGDLVLFYRGDLGHENDPPSRGIVLENSNPERGGELYFGDDPPSIYTLGFQPGPQVSGVRLGRGWVPDDLLPHDDAAAAALIARRVAAARLKIALDQLDVGTPVRLGANPSFESGFAAGMAWAREQDRRTGARGVSRVTLPSASIRSPPTKHASRS